jgi:hypothetical protein
MFSLLLIGDAPLEGKWLLLGWGSRGNPWVNLVYISAFVFFAFEQSPKVREDLPKLGADDGKKRENHSSHPLNEGLQRKCGRNSVVGYGNIFELQCSDLDVAVLVVEAVNRHGFEEGNERGICITAHLDFDIVGRFFRILFAQGVL